MRNIIIYSAFSPEETLDCSYSLLKYLDIYNLKPPADHSLVIYTSDPAALEAYGSFFRSFELKDLYQRNVGPEHTPDFIRQAAEPYEGNILYVGSATYPVKELDGIFSDISRGAVFLDQHPSPTNGREPVPAFQQLSALGFISHQREKITGDLNNLKTQTSRDTLATYQDLKEFRILLRHFFRRHQEESIPNQVKLMHTLDPLVILEEKKKFLKQPLYARLLNKMMGRGWSISRYTSKL